MLASEMDGMAAPEKLQDEGRDGDGCGLKLVQRLSQPREVDGIREDDKTVSRLNSAAP